jgi:ankyrin repeat protein
MRHLVLIAGVGLAALAGRACGGGPALPLAVAAARNAAGAVQQLLQEGRRADQRDDSGVTALMWAARNGAVDAIRALLDGGADPNLRDARHGWTALAHAVHKRQVECVRVLLERGADPNARAGLTTPLMMAAADADPTIVRLLLARGADPTARGAGGSTALSEAVSGGALSDIDRPLFGGCRPATVRALLSHDPTLQVPDTIAGGNALWWARVHGCRDVLELVRRSASRHALESPKPQGGS